MEKKWMEDITTSRKYKLTDNITTWVIVNEFIQADCPEEECNKVQYCRLTHIWQFDNSQQCIPNYHVNFDTDLEALKKMEIVKINDKGVFEKEVDGKWILQLETGETVANIDESK